jgi:hypothetical protein
MGRGSGIVSASTTTAARGERRKNKQDGNTSPPGFYIHELSPSRLTKLANGADRGVSRLPPYLERQLTANVPLIHCGRGSLRTASHAAPWSCLRVS